MENWVMEALDPFQGWVISFPSVALQWIFHVVKVIAVSCCQMATYSAGDIILCWELGQQWILLFLLQQ